MDLVSSRYDFNNAGSYNENAHAAGQDLLWGKPLPTVSEIRRQLVRALQLSA